MTTYTHNQKAAIPALPLSSPRKLRTLTSPCPKPLFTPIPLFRLAPSFQLLASNSILSKISSLPRLTSDFQPSTLNFFHFTTLSLCHFATSYQSLLKTLPFLPKPNPMLPKPVKKLQLFAGNMQKSSKIPPLFGYITSTIPRLHSLHNPHFFLIYLSDHNTC